MVLPRWLRFLLGRPEAAAPGSPVETVTPPPPAPIEQDIDADPLADTKWLSLVEECVALYDELDRFRPTFDPPRQELAEHVCLRLQEILERSGVECFDEDGTFDRQRHEPARAGVRAELGTQIDRIVSPGFRIDRRILRRARVQLIDDPIVEKGIPV